ncbi:DUF1223 domain-containing protein [Rariglobus hedericola]|uniref:DUF1223 domain-containing protein n=1 Tax=Rariglobus hedericola TaxID=2597822 RepID=A0A556QPC2_9BACT|nr:DUF1223 domain-containing protein [Rariglobus hedericola]TSJ78485.1 DUF1223 domain-containing protein [Rariglobus hedericola]
MLKLPGLPAFLVLVAIASSSSARAQIFQSDAVATPLIELYTSEGCSSCPPAERWLSALKTDAGLWCKFVPVAFHVTYWDYLGWNDPFAQSGFTDRQRAYADAWNARSVYTPGFVHQGREWRPGNPVASPTTPGILTVERSAAGSGTVRFSPTSPVRQKTYTATIALLGSDVSIAVKSGENAGRSLPHDFIALHIATVALTAQPDGTFTGTFAAPPATLPSTPRRALAAWVSTTRDQTPLQATGGWLP